MTTPRPTPPVLFLDIDGVLNSADWMRRRGPGLRSGCHPDMLDPDACKRLHRVLCATGCDVVLSSAWRYSVRAATVRDGRHQKPRQNEGPCLETTMIPRCDLLVLTEWLAAKGCAARFVGMTPTCPEMGQTETAEIPGHPGQRLYVGARERGHEIQAWLDAHPERERFAIVDDSDDMAHLKAWLVRTDHEHGLLDEHCERLVAMLGKRGP